MVFMVRMQNGHESTQNLRDANFIPIIIVFPIYVNLLIAGDLSTFDAYEKQ